MAAAIINGDGFLVDPKVRIRIIPALGKKKMAAIHGVVIHQTGGSSLEGALSAATQGQGIGAHFYIDKDGSIIQAASLNSSCMHVGLLKPRCMVEHRCKPEQERQLSRMRPRDVSKLEYEKEFPERYPGNSDSVGIELVGYFHAVPGKQEPEYDVVTSAQQSSLKWLVDVICRYKAVKASEVYRHPQVSWKNPSEAVTAKW